MIIKELIDSLNNKEIYNFGDNMHIIKDITVYGKKENLDIIRKNMEEQKLLMFLFFFFYDNL